MCHEIRPFQVWTTGLVDQVGGFTIGPAGPEQWEVICTVCGIPIWHDGNPYSCYSTERSQSVDALLEHTNPRFARLRSERLLLEQRLQSGVLAASERAELMLESFRNADRALAWSLHKRSGLQRVRTVIKWTLLGTIPWILFVTALRWPDLMMWLPLMISGAWLVVMLTRHRGRARRMTQTWLIPAIVAAIRPLQPSLTELEDALQRLGNEPNQIRVFLIAAELDVMLRRAS
jgi:hypothetical protein